MAKHPSSQYPWARRIVNDLTSVGHEAYFCGGWVRDLLLGREAHDVDVVTSATPDQISALFRRTRLVGKIFGVVLVFGGPSYVEVSTFRADNLKGKAKGFVDGKEQVAKGMVYGTRQEDAFRRDFTCNALYYDPARQKVIDDVGGIRDIRNGIIRSLCDPNIRFKEDPLRIMRGIRFAVQFGWKIEPRTWLAMRRHSNLILDVAIERIHEEVKKHFQYRVSKRSLMLLQVSGIWRTLMGSRSPIASMTSPAVLSGMERLRPGMISMLAWLHLSSGFYTDKDLAWTGQRLHLTMREKTDLERLVRLSLKMSHWNSLTFNERSRVHLQQGFRDAWAIEYARRRIHGYPVGDWLRIGRLHEALNGGAPPRLLSPQEIRSRGVTISSAELKYLLKKLRKAQWDGWVRTRQDAWRWLLHHLEIEDLAGRKF